MSEPVPVIPLEYAETPSDRPATWERVTRVAIVLAWLCCAIGWALIIFVDVETVIASGPLLTALGLVMLFGGLRLRRPSYWVLGSAHCAICILFVVLVNVRHWSPADAATPFAVMGGMYALLATAGSAWAWFHGRPHAA